MCGRSRVSSLAVEPDLAGLRPDQAAEHVQEGGLTGPVRADDSGDLAGGRGQRDVVKSSDAAEPDRHRPDFQRPGLTSRNVRLRTPG